MPTIGMIGTLMALVTPATIVASTDTARALIVGHASVAEHFRRQERQHERSRSRDSSTRTGTTKEDARDRQAKRDAGARSDPTSTNNGRSVDGSGPAKRFYRNA